jgi:subtilisin family serine protease
MIAGMRRIGVALTLCALVAAFAPMAAQSASATAGSSPRVTVPNDPLFLNDPQCSGVPNCVNQQWNLMADGRGDSADKAWDVTKGEGVTVAVLDSGIDPNHEDLVDQLVKGYDFYQNDSDPTDGTGFGHGTGTAGVVGAEQDNAKGGSGTAPGIKIMPLRVSDTFIVAPTRLAQAITYATDHGAQVISMSIGLIQTDTMVQDAVAHAHDHGVVLLDAMANEFSTHPNTPAYLDDVIGVGGIVPDTDGSNSNTASDFTVKATYSNYGAGIDVVSPTDVYTTDFGGGYGKIDGTSGATPGVAGIAALIESRAIQKGLTLSSDEVTQIIRMSADDLVGGPYNYKKGWDQYTGWGRADAWKAIQMVAPKRIPPVANITSPDWYAPVGSPIDVQGTVSSRASTFTWTLQVGQGVEPAAWTKIGSGGGSGSFTGTLGSFDPTGQPNGLYTLRLDVNDSAGNHGQDRQAFNVTIDPHLVKGFPKDLGASVESSPQFADLNGDGKDELIVADANGVVHAFTS